LTRYYLLSEHGGINFDDLSYERLKSLSVNLSDRLRLIKLSMDAFEKLALSR
jgi:hypothetical protein